ncbi:hypothetical protein GCK72_006890 [Caenorhabditis remanei]|uniref:G protein-coupled receptor n=1 Tax=Caenorhabditis remanei TaxID=31234 RepID=A0A6A5HM74_CAERE|nr:hypothetical protein GCK72_006890 [Caenorhabditis remanei]KAF1766932.1 hypothetical protein GCK72_006890 [Caenorhabditis remanei]
MIDFVIPQWLVIYYYSVGTVSLVLNSITIYLIIFRSDNIDSFRYYILVFQTNCAITDVHTTILMQPFPLHPMICGHYKGLIGTFFEVNSYYHAAFSITSIITQVEALVFCFYRKHQTIAKVMNGHVCPKAFTYFMNTSATVTPIFIFYALLEAGMTRQEQLDYVKKCILAVFSLRSSVNAIVLIVTTPPYRKFVLRIKPRLNSIAVSSSGNSNNALHH